MIVHGLDQEPHRVGDPGEPGCGFLRINGLPKAQDTGAAISASPGR